ncbi:MAG: RIP metalloprotease RseP, partial [Pseudomonadota bacterium]
MIYAIGFIVLIGLLVLAHEFGHFLMGRLCGVRVEIFSLGFGKTLLRKKIGYTEYRLSLFPLGGYVKFLGDESEKKDLKKVPIELRRYSFNYQSVYKRALIVFGGPLFNFILAVVLFMFVYFIGEPNVASVIGYVEKDSAAFNSGLVEGDKITAVNGKKVELWTEADELISKQKDRVVLAVVRGQETRTVTVPVKEMLARSKFGEPIHKMGIEY